LRFLAQGNSRGWLKEGLQESVGKGVCKGDEGNGK